MTDAASMDRLMELHASLEREHGVKAEVFHRRVDRVKAVRPSPDARAFRATGSEEGLAVRLLGDDGGCSFGASSGGGPEALAWALRAAASSGCRMDGRWATGDGSRVLDLEFAPELPSIEHLDSWLESAIEALQEAGVPATEGGIGEAWIEAGASVETLVAHGGLAARRSRSRIWAVARVGGFGCRSSLVGSAARWLHVLEPDSWASQVARVGAPKRRPVRTVIFDAEAAARLALLLGREFHSPGARLGSRVGAGWCVLDDPLDPEGVVGGSFDDAGFPTETRILADGIRTHDLLRPTGHLRRPSFRDLPSPTFSTLTVRGPSIDAPETSARIRDLRIHRLAPDRWLLDAAGVYSLEASPTELIERCVGTTGPLHRSPLGVLTPALVIDGWSGGRSTAGQVP